MVVGYHHFRKPPYVVDFFEWNLMIFWTVDRRKTEQHLPPEKHTEKMQTFFRWTSTPKTPINSDADNFNIYFLQTQPSYPVKLQRYAIFQWKIPTPSWWSFTLSKAPELIESGPCRSLVWDAWRAQEGKAWKNTNVLWCLTVVICGDILLFFHFLFS